MKLGACLALAAVFAVSACGGTGHDRLSKRGYESKLKTAFAAANAGLAPAPHTAGSVDLLKRIAKSYGGIAAALTGLRVPANVQALNDRLATAAAARADALNALVAKLVTASPSDRQRLLAQYDAAQVGRDFDRAVAGLVAGGYRFRPSAGT
jgi:hypothetical protein